MWQNKTVRINILDLAYLPLKLGEECPPLRTYDNKNIFIIFLYLRVSLILGNFSRPKVIFSLFIDDSRSIF